MEKQPTDESGGIVQLKNDISLSKMVGDIQDVREGAC